MKKLLLTTALVTAFALTQPAFAAHEGEKHETAASAVATPVLPTADALTALQTGMATIDALAKEGKEGIHEEIEKLEAGPIASLMVDTSIATDKKNRLEASLKQLKAQLGKVHDAADKKDTATTASELKKAHAALKLVEATLK